MKYLFIVILFLFTGCSNIQEKIKNTIQSENATHIRDNYKELTQLLLEYKVKLDKRNPKAFSKNLNQIFKENIRNNTDKMHLYIHSSIPLKQYQDYLNYAFDKNAQVKYRDDYLVIGIYKMFYKAFNMDSKYKLTALSYDVKELQKAYKNLQIIQWRIKFSKDKNNNFLFLTWQNNWQIELSKKLAHEKLESIKLNELQYIKSKQESLLGPSNNSFEVITSKMLLYFENTLRSLDTEPEELSTTTIMSVLFII